MTPILWATVLLLLGIGIIFLEIFVPSGGLLGFLAGTTVVSAVVIVFVYEGFSTGVMFLLVTTISIPFAISGAVRWWPHTAMGRRILNLPPGEEAQITAPPDYQPLQKLVGQRGLAVSKMIPSGAISLAGKTYDAVSQAGAIAKGQPVEIVSVDGTRIMVRRVPERSDSPTETPTGSDQPSDEKMIPDPFE